MSDKVKYTERDLVLAKREAFVAGACDTTFASRIGASSEANRRYTLPKVEQPRVETGADGWSFRVINGKLESRGPKDLRWYPSQFVPQDRVAVAAKVLANPTELIEDTDEDEE